MEIHGFKIFNNKFQNHYGKTFEVGKIYRVSGPIKFGLGGCGFHFCKNLEDIFRYAEKPSESIIALVVGRGKILEQDDEYYGYYEKYSAEILEIISVLNREDILNIAKEMHYLKLERLLQSYPMTEEELSQLTIKEKSTQLVIDYYQKKDKLAYQKYYHFDK